MSAAAVLREMQALGLRRSAAFVWYRLKRTLRRLTPHQRPDAQLSDAQWLAGLTGSPEEAARLFLAGSAGLGWWAASDPARAAQDLRKRFPEHVALVTQEAEAIAGGTVVILGRPTRVTDARGVVEWQRDWFGEYRWSGDMLSNEIPVGRQPGADPRVAWELGRCHHVLTLAQGFVLAGDERLGEAAVEQMLAFLTANPVGRGIQWTSTMDVAIRACNWMAAWQFLRRSKAARQAALPVLRSLVEHGRFIELHLENQDGITSNHYLANLAGLACLGHFAPLWPPAVRWTDRWRKETPREVDRQVLEDGFDFEASTSYHRLALELLAFPLVDGRLTGELPPPTRSRILEMCRATERYLSRNGRAPQFGDNDGGRLYVLHPRHPLDHSYLPGLGQAVGGGPATAETPETVWLFGPMATTPLVTAPAALDLLPHGGIVALRDEGVEFFFTCGPNGQGDRGGHAHNDKLSFVLMVGGEDIITDPGTGEYTRDASVRQLFRSTLFHSTLALADAEQNRLSRISTFRLIPDARPLGPAARLRGNRTIVAGAHTGYDRAPIRLRHQRRISHRPGTRRWEVLDVVHSLRPGPRPRRESVVFTLPLAPGVTVRQVTPSGWELATRTGTVLRGEVRVRGIIGEWKVEDGWVSPNYGERVATMFLRYRGSLLPSWRRGVIHTVIHVDHV